MSSTSPVIMVALVVIGFLLYALFRQGHITMTKIDDLTAAVTDFKAAQAEQLTAIDIELKQLADAIANSGLTPDQQAALQNSIDAITGATTAMRTSTAKLASDDPTA